jgi:hypothetical protein
MMVSAPSGVLTGPSDQSRPPRYREGAETLAAAAAAVAAADDVRDGGGLVTRIRHHRLHTT